MIRVLVAALPLAIFVLALIVGPAQAWTPGTYDARLAEDAERCRFCGHDEHGGEDFPCLRCTCRGRDRA